MRFAHAPSRVAALALGLLALSASLCRAQPLADKVPGDPILYVGWLGYDSKSPGFDNSHFKAVLDEGEVYKLISETLPDVLEKVGARDRDAANAIKMAQPIVMPMLKHASAFFIGKSDLTENGQPQISVGMLCDAGNEAGAMELRIKDLLSQMPQDVQKLVKVSNNGGLVSVLADMGSTAGATTFEQSAGFKAIQQHTVKDASLMMYLDVEQLVKLSDKGVDQFVQDREPKELWPKIRDAIGLKSVKQVVLSSGFDGKDWSDHLFIFAPSPRSGLVALADPTPLSEAALKSIPESATMAGATRFDVPKLIAGLRQAIANVEPGAEQQIDQVFDEASKRIGMDIQKDLLATLGHEWVYYVDPMTGGRGPGGMVLLNKLKDPKKAEKAFSKLEDLLNDTIAQQIPKNEGITVKMQTTQVDGTTLHYLGTPLVSPAWAIKGDTLLVALYPQMVAGAMTQLGAGHSILDNPGYKKLRDRLGVKNAHGMAFIDLPKTAPDSYATWVAVSRLSGFADVFGVSAPPMLLPPLGKLMPHLAPAGSVSWTDEQGIHVKSLSPFPGSTLFASNPLSSVQGISPILASVALPSLNRAREQANRIKSASNLRQIALAAHIYAADHKGNFPPTLDELTKGSDLPPTVLSNPRTGQSPPPSGSDYVYVGGGKTTAAASNVVIAYERMEGLTDGINIAFADAHVEFMTMAEAHQIIDGK